MFVLYIYNSDTCGASKRLKEHKIYALFKRLDEKRKDFYLIEKNFTINHRNNKTYYRIDILGKKELIKKTPTLILKKRKIALGKSIVKEEEVLTIEGFDEKKIIKLFKKLENDNDLGTRKKKEKTRVGSMFSNDGEKLQKRFYKNDRNFKEFKNSTKDINKKEGGVSRKNHQVNSINREKGEKFIKGTPYINLGKPIEDLIPKEFKKSYKGVYSNLFRRVRNHHNIDLGVKTQEDLSKLMKKMNYYGIIYKITQMKDEKGTNIHYGPCWVREGKIIKAGYHRIGRTIILDDRLTVYERDQTGYHFENIFQKLGRDAFIFEILAVCKSQKEYIATEYFWQLYFNREKNADGYDLRNNGNFNNRLGSMYDDLLNPILPKYVLVNDILSGLDRFELDEKYKHLKDKVSIKQALIKYFGIESIFKIRAILIAPKLENCLRRGLTEQETIKKLIDSGFGMFNENIIQERVKKYGLSSTRTNPKNLFQRILKYIYGVPRIQPTRVFTHYEQIRKEKFFVPFIEYLKNENINEIIGESQNSENTLSLIDFLYERGLSPTYIVRYLGYYGEEAKKLIIKINNYLNRRWSPLIEPFSWDKLRLFLKTHPLIMLTLSTYLKYL